MTKHLDSKQIFTNGSKSEEDIGFGLIHRQNLQHRACVTPPKEAFVFSEELHAILKTQSIIKKFRTSKMDNFFIFSGLSTGNYLSKS